MVKNLRLGLLAVAVGISSVYAGEMDRPGGIKVGQRMIIRPYVSIGYTLDSNVDSSHKRGDAASSFFVSPAFSFDYRGDNWSLLGSAYAQYHVYTGDTCEELSNWALGETLGWSFSNVEDGRGWSVHLTESYVKMLQDDDATSSEGRGLGRDRQQFSAGANIDRRMNQWWHFALDGSMYWLDYDNSVDRYAPLYGWARYTLGGDVGFTASKWTDIIITGNYSGYLQDNDRNLSGGAINGRINDTSEGVTLHAGFGTYMTERISYRVTAGWTHFEYGNVDETDGFTYSINCRWKMQERWNMMLMASSYYAPSERDYGSSTRNDVVSIGFSHALIRNKLNATLDLSYRHEMHDQSAVERSDYSLDILTARAGLTYTLNRFASLYGNVEYQTEINDNTDNNDAYDYDRWRMTVGVRFTY